MILPADLMMKHGLHRSTVLKGPKCEEEMRALQDTVQARLLLPLPLLSSHVDTYIHSYMRSFKTTILPYYNYVHVICQDLASQAWAHLSKVEKLSALARSQHPASRSVFLPSVSHAHYLKTLQRADFDPFAAAPLLSESTANLKLQFKLLYANMSGDLSI